MTKNKASLLALSAFLFFFNGSSSVFSMMHAEDELPRDHRHSPSIKITEITRGGFKMRDKSEWCSLVPTNPVNPLPSNFSYVSFNKEDLTRAIRARIERKESLSPANPLNISVRHTYLQEHREEFSEQRFPE